MGNKTAFARVADRPYLIEVNGVYFTQREVEIISHLMGGKSIKTIANSLNLSPRTVEVYLNKIKSKVNKTSRDGIIDFIEKSGRLLDFKQYYLTNMKGYENSSIIRENSELQEKIEPPEDKNLSSFAKRKYVFAVLAISFLLSSSIYFSVSLDKSIDSMLFYQKKPFIRPELAVPSKKVLLERSELMTQIKKKLKGNEGIQKIALVGSVGAGKTVLARQFVKTQKASIIWEINAETKETLIRSFFDFAYMLAEKENKTKEIEFIENLGSHEEKKIHLLALIKEYLKNCPNWLLIYDDVDDISGIYAYLPNDSKVWGIGKVIITTKNENIKNSIYLKPDQIIHITELNNADALMLFSKVLYNIKSNKLSSTQKEKLLNLLKDVPFFPLDISMRAHHLKNMYLSRK